MRIRPLQAADLSEVRRIEQQVMTDPWNEELLLAEFEVTNGVSLVAEEDNQIWGYAFFRICAPESELLRLAVAGDRRRKGAGQALLDHALRDFTGQGYTSCFLEVRCSNEEARRLYMKAGFLQVGIRKKYYHQPVEDAPQLCKDLNDPRRGNP